MVGSWFFDGWSGVLRVVVMGLLSYGFLILLLRLADKRTLSQMNPFDFVITVASGSTVAAVLLNETVSLAEGAMALSMLAIMQYGVASISAHSARAERLVKNPPTILVWRGQMRRDVMVRMRVTEGEVLAACRQAGLANLAEVEAVVLESAGSFSVMPRQRESVAPRDSTLRTAV